MKTDYKAIEIPDFFVVMKWIEKEGKCMFDLHKELNLTYCHLHQLKKSFLDLKWIYIQKDFRRHNMFLTDKGKEIVQISTQLFLSMGFDEEKILEYIEKYKFKKVNIDKEKLIQEVEESDIEQQVEQQDIVEDETDILDYNIEDEWKVE